jgi:hypothetical protein
LNLEYRFGDFSRVHGFESFMPVVQAPGATDDFRNVERAIGQEQQNSFPNSPGMRYVTDNRRTCQLVMNISDEILILAMKNLGYELTDQKKYPTDSLIPGAPIFYFEKT